MDPGHDDCSTRSDERATLLSRDDRRPRRGAQAHGALLGAGSPFCAATLDGQKVEWLGIRDEEFKTEKGITAGMHRAQWEAAYGKPPVVIQAYPEEVAGQGWIERFVYDEIGLAVYVLKPSDVLGRVLVFRPGAAKSLWRF